MDQSIKTYLGMTPQIGKNVFIDQSACIIGDVVIGDDCSIWPMAVIRGDMNSIRIGDRTSIQDGTILHITHKRPENPKGHPLVIGSDVTVGHKAVLHGCTIHNRVLIGIGAIVLDGAVVEEEVIVAAGCLVPPGKRLTSGFVYKGSPAEATRPVTDKEKDYFTYTAGNYVKLKNEYLNNT